MLSLRVVIYNTELYEVFYSYTSGYLELKTLYSEIDDIILVHQSDVSPFQEEAQEALYRE